ncbi:MAG: DUF58 domain-containing protein [Psychrobacter sp.]|nr:DUF58 domain-containing protein [Psychrobacter sp.]
MTPVQTPSQLGQDEAQIASVLPHASHGEGVNNGLDNDGNKRMTQTAKGTRPATLRLWQRLWQFQPSGRLVKLLVIWWSALLIATALNLTGGFGYELLEGLASPLLTALIWLLALFAAVTLIELVSLVAISQVSSYRVTRQFPSNVPIYHDLDIQARVSFAPSHASKRAQAIIKGGQQLGWIKAIPIDFYDDYPDQLTLTEPMPIAAQLPLSNATGNANIKISYPVLPTERGTGLFRAAYLRVWSPLKLFHRSLTLPNEVFSKTDSAISSLSNQPDSHAENAVYLRVLADFSGLMSNQLAAIFDKSVQAGVQALMQQGQGSDFLMLREYSQGDAIRQIDWKASARLRKLMSKAYEDDNDQDVMFLLDCGEQMRHQDAFENDSDIDAKLHTEQLIQARRADGTLDIRHHASYFDKVLNAVLLLSYIANKQSDKVGLMTFGVGNSTDTGGQVLSQDIYMPPTKGVALIRNMLNQTADLKPSMQTSDYLLAAQDLLKKLKKRSLIILITNTRAEASHELTQAVNLLSRRHQVVFANLMEQVVFDRLYGDMIPMTMDDALLYHSLVDYAHGREQLHQLLNQQTGALCLQTTANKLPLTLTQAYLSLKRK